MNIESLYELLLKYENIDKDLEVFLIEYLQANYLQLKKESFSKIIYSLK